MKKLSKLVLATSGFTAGMIFEYCLRVDNSNKWAIGCGIIISVSIILKVFNDE